MIDDIFYNGQYIWNQQKNERNKKVHGIPFETASQVFYKPFLIIEYDEENSTTEDRYNATAYLDGFSYVTVTFTDRNDMKRIISARKADSEEIEAYHENLRSIIGDR
jgi:uncharacterized DUF497 family protein